MRCRQVFLLFSCLFLGAAPCGCTSLLGDFTVTADGTEAGDASTSGGDATVEGATNGGDAALNADANGDGGTVNRDGATHGDDAGPDAIASVDAMVGDGGNCQGPAGAACSPYLCGASACKKPCAADADCVSGYYCSAGACLAQKSQGGSPCARDAECQSGLSCSLEGICCNSPCTGACQVCNSAGMCSPTPPNSQPRAGHGTCTGAGAAPCGGYCDGVDIGCFYPTTQCSAASCGCYPAGGCHSAPAVNCSNGTCPNAVLVSCNGFTCDTTMTACNQVCDPSNDVGCYGLGPGASCCHTVFTGVCFHNCTTTCPGSGVCM